jgi:choline dehydrogenase
MGADATPSDGTFDYIIVGGGTAGCVLANRLSADPASRVLLLEAGGSDEHFWIRVPLGLSYILGNPKFDWRYASEPEPHLNNRRLNVPRGRVLGGSSSINGMVYVRGHAYDFDQWRQAGNAGWAWDDVLPYFKRSEDYFRGANDRHGSGGELSVIDPGVRWDILDAYKQAAIEAGIPLTEDYNGGDNEGVSYFEAMIRNGVRWSTSRGFLKPVRGRPNLRIVTGALVSRLIVAGRSVHGVAYSVDGVARRADSSGEVLLCAGAIGSPQILQMSGIGDGGLVQAIGVSPVHDLPGVGENLQDHWMLRFQHRVQGTTTLNAWAQNPLRKAIMGLRYLALRQGPMSAQPALLAAFAKSDPSAAAPDIEIHVSPASYGRVGGPMHPFPGITSSVGILRPTSRGHVRARSSDPAAHPAILHNFLATDYDQRIALDCVKLVRRIAAQEPLARFKPDEISPRPDIVTHEQVIAWARDTLTTVFHPVGTCAMGRGDRSVVDERLRVRGLAGLRVVDASIMPTITSGNTCAPVIMIAEKAADLIVEDRRTRAAA